MGNPRPTPVGQGREIMRLLIQSHVDNAKARDKGIDVICYTKLTQWLKITAKSLILQLLRAKRLLMSVSS